MSGQPLESLLRERLESRRPEIERAVLARVYGVSDPTGTDDPEYTLGLRAAVSVALDYGLAAIGCNEERIPPVPPALLAQARAAARSGVGLDTVLRRYFAGYMLLGDFLIGEVEEGGLVGGAELKHLLRAQATLFDRVQAAVSEEYGREGRRRRPDTLEQRRVERVKRLLAGELLDAKELAYDLDAHHLGAIATGAGAGEAVRDLARALDRRLLSACPDEGIVWAWLGGRRPVDLEELERFLGERWASEISLAIGEPGQGRAGWRLTHHQAKAALPIASRSSESHIYYRDVALLASMLRDDLLVTSLRELYLAPLERERDGGQVVHETLRAYFAAGRNVSSAAAALGVDRKTVNNRLRLVEEQVGRPLSSCVADVEAALRLDEMGGVAMMTSPP